MMDNWLDIVRREAQHVLSTSEPKSTLVVTAYNPDTHSVKGVIVPHGVESGWMPVAEPHIGNGFGMLVGPNVGSAGGLNGDQFDVEFEFGDPNSPVARHRVFSSPDKPPRVESGEILIKHQGTASIYFDKNNVLTITGAGGADQKVVFMADGSIVLTDKGGATITLKDGTILSTDAGGSEVYQNEGNVYLGSKTASAAVVTTSGPSVNVFAKV